MNFFNGFCTALARDKHYEYCSSIGHLKVKIPSDKEKCLKLHDGQISPKFHLCYMQALKES